MTKISQLSSIGSSLAVGDEFLIRDVDDGATPNKSVTTSGVARGILRAFETATEPLLLGTTVNTNSSRLVASGTISETISGVQYRVASSYDIGTGANQVPLNGLLGQMAFVDEPFAQVQSSVADAAIAVDAAVVDLYSHIASFSADRTVQISNLTSGQQMKLYLRNTNASSRTITIQASATASGHTSVNLAPGAGTMGAASVSTVSLAATSGTSVVWVANINNNVVGGILA
jgi:hypothetical protein